MFTDKIAIVTGAGRGIGKEIALELARGGAKCVINYASSATGAESVAEEIRAMGSEAMTYKLLRFRKTGRGDSAGDRSSRRKGRSPSV